VKRTTALYAVTALAALSFTGQAFAMGGGMGGGNMSGDHRMTSTMSRINGGSMQTGSGMPKGAGSADVQRTGMQQGSRNGTTGTPSIMKNGAGNQHGQVSGGGDGMIATQHPATTTTR